MISNIEALYCVFVFLKNYPDMGRLECYSKSEVKTILFVSIANIFAVSILIAILVAVQILIEIHELMNTICKT